MTFQSVSTDFDPKIYRDDQQLQLFSTWSVYNHDITQSSQMVYGRIVENTMNEFQESFFYQSSDNIVNTTWIKVEQEKNLAGNLNYYA